MQQLSPRATSNMQYQPHTAMQHQSPPEPYRNIQDNYQGNMDADMYLEPSNNNNNSYMRQKPLQRNIHENDSGMYISLGLIWHKYQSLCNHELSVVFWRCLPVSSCVVVDMWSVLAKALITGSSCLTYAPVTYVPGTCYIDLPKCQMSLGPQAPILLR